MTYKETLEFLYSQVPMFQNLGAGAYKPGLGTTLALAAHWQNPHKQISTFIHVGGTNGKGSTAHTLAAVMQSAGYKTGLYTSPHLLDFRERIRINGNMVSEQFVTDFVAEYTACKELTALRPTFFELTTIMALSYFAKENVDVAIIEVGLGGRLDCTNIITPCLSIITNISLDHTALLGDTEVEIAREKAGIIKHGIPVVIGRASGAVRKVFADKAAEEDAPVTFACDKPFFTTLTSGDSTTRRHYRNTPWGELEGELTGDCQIENTATILAALEILKHRFTRIDSRAVKAGFANVCELTGLMGRWSILQHEPVEVICDTGHNIGGWQLLGPKLKDLASRKRLHMVLGFVNDKDVGAIMGQMPQNAVYYYATPSVNRGRAAEETAAVAASFGLAGKAYGSVAEAFTAAREAATAGDTIFVGGSTFIVADLLAYLSEIGL